MSPIIENEQYSGLVVIPDRKEYTKQNGRLTKTSSNEKNKLTAKKVAFYAASGLMLIVALSVVGYDIPDVVDNLHEVAVTAMAGGFAVLRTKKKKSKSKEKLEEVSDDSADKSGSGGADFLKSGGGGSGKSGPAGNRPKSVGFNQAGRWGPAAYSGMPIRLITQIDSTNYAGLDQFLAAGYVGGYDAATGVDTPRSYISVSEILQSDGSSHTPPKWEAVLNPRAYTVISGDPTIKEADLERISALSPAHAGGLLARMLKDRTSDLDEMDVTLGNEGHLFHWFQLSQQAGQWFRRLQLALLIEEQAEIGRAVGKVGSTSDHTRPAYANLYEEIKPLFVPADANLDLTKNDYTIKEWVEGYLKTFNPTLVTTSMVGRSRGRFVLHKDSFEMGFSGLPIGASSDMDGNPILLIPNQDIGDHTEAGTIRTSLGGNTSQGIVASNPGDGADLTQSVLNAVHPWSETVNTLTVHGAVDNKDMVYHTVRYEDIRLKPEVTPNTGRYQKLMADYPTFDWTLDPGEVLSQITVKGPSELIGMFWGQSDFVGYHNIVDKVEAGVEWNPQQSLLNATPTELIAELSALNSAWPQTMFEYQELLGTCSDVAPYMDTVIEVDYSWLVDELNLHSKYQIDFNPKNAGVQHAGPGYDPLVSERYWEKKNLTPEQIATNMAVKFPLMTVFGADRDRKIADADMRTGIASYFNADVASSLLPSDGLAKKGEHAVHLPMGVTRDAFKYTGITPVSGAEIVHRLMLSANQPVMDYSRRYPCSDLNFGSVSSDMSELLFEPLYITEMGGTVSKRWFTQAPDSTMLSGFVDRVRLAILELNLSQHSTYSRNEEVIGSIFTKVNEKFDDIKNAKKGTLKKLNSDFWLPPLHVTSSDVMPCMARRHEKALDAVEVRNITGQVTSSVGTYQTVYVPSGTLFGTEDGMVGVYASTGLVPYQGITQRGLVATSDAKLKATATSPHVNVAVMSNEHSKLYSGSSNVVAGHYDVKTPENALSGTYSYGMHTMLMAEYFTDVWGAYLGGENAMTNDGLEFTLDITGTNNPLQPTQKMYINYVRVGPNGISGPAESVNIVKARHAANQAIGAFELDPGVADFGQALYQSIMGNVNVPDVSSAKDRRVKELYETYDVYWITVENGGILEAADGTFIESVPAEMATLVALSEHQFPGEDMANINVTDLFGDLTISFGNDQDVIDPLSYSLSRVSWTENVCSGYHVAGITGEAVFTPRKIIPNNVSAFFHPELNLVDAAVLFYSTPREHRLAWIEGRDATPMHGELIPTQYGLLLNQGLDITEELLEQLSLPLFGQDLTKFRISVGKLSGIMEGRLLYEANIINRLKAIGYQNLTREEIYRIEEGSRR